jgi:MFS family permease
MNSDSDSAKKDLSSPSQDGIDKAHDEVDGSDKDKQLDKPKEGDNDKNDDDVEYPQGFRLAGICIALVTAIFIVASSNTIIATAIPTISAFFKTYEDVQWYIAAELILACAFQLPFGQAYSLLNVKWVFLASLILYLIGSAVCGAAPTSFALVFGRAIAGIGNAGVIGGSFIIISGSTPLDKRPIFIGLVSATFSIAAVVGPLIGTVPFVLRRLIRR